jgi:endonuclease YncB( thermonuclease family)
MAQGLLQLTGTIDVDQFWPKNMSDGDTVTVVVDPDGFEFSSNPAGGEPFRVTHIFDDAVSQGSGTKKVVHDGKVTIRLEDADCAELHYSVPVPGTHIFRQHTGETATTKLHDLIASVTARPVPCKVRTAVDHPSDVFDTYGRMIGNIFIYPDGKEVNANHWLIRSGWAFPTFYNSASAAEISEVLKLAEEARKAQRGAWACLSNNLLHPNFSLLFRRHGVPDPVADLGTLVMPKMFRRQVLWHVKKGAHEFSGTFVNFLEKQKDGWVRLADFLHDPAIKPSSNTRDLSLLVDEHGAFTCGPADIVFFEKPSTLHNAKGKKIASWWKTPAEASSREEKHTVAA